MLLDVERAIALRSYDDDTRTAAIEVAEQPFAILVRAAVGAGVAIDAKDSGRDLIILLLRDETEGLLAFR